MTLRGDKRSCSAIRTPASASPSAAASLQKRTSRCTGERRRARTWRHFGPIGDLRRDLRRDLLPENVETTVPVERGLLFHEFPARLRLVVEQQLKATLAAGVLVRVVGAPELFDAVLPLSAHAPKVL